MIVSISIPLVLDTENVLLRKHWTARYKFKKKLKLYLISELRKYKLSPPCIVTLIRHSPRQLDDDNLPGAFKETRDIVADYLIPGLAPGRADSNPLISWKYQQIPRKGFKGFSVIVDTSPMLSP